MSVVSNHSGLKGKFIMGLFPSGYVFVWGFIFFLAAQAVQSLLFLFWRAGMFVSKGGGRWAASELRAEQWHTRKNFQIHPLNRDGRGVKISLLPVGQHNLGNTELLLGGHTETFCLSQSPSGISHKPWIHLPSTNKWISPVCLILHRISS